MEVGTQGIWVSCLYLYGVYSADQLDPSFADNVIVSYKYLLPMDASMAEESAFNDYLSSIGKQGSSAWIGAPVSSLIPTTMTPFREEKITKLPNGTAAGKNAKYIHFIFNNIAGLADFYYAFNAPKKLAEYFNRLFGIQKTLGNRKLEDGNLCKNCAAKLSPWFSERRSSTVAQIREQLNYREENRAAVADFNTTRSLRNGTKVLLDEGNRKFMVTSARNLTEVNPDVLEYSQVTDCKVDVQERKSELKRKDKDGKQISYVPPRYEYSYDFYIIINVNHPYFDEIKFKLNSSSIKGTPPPVRPGGATTISDANGCCEYCGGSVNGCVAIALK